MKLLSLWLVVIVNHHLLLIQRCSSADDCIFVYTQQPPSCLFCNPYNTNVSSPQVEVTMACGAKRTDDKKDTETFDLRWFSNYSSERLDHESDVRTHPFSNISILATSPGQYWCQVLDYTNGTEHLLGKSNVVEVLSLERYSSLPKCEGVQSVMESKCADLIPSPSTTSMIDSPMCIVSKTESPTHSITESPSIPMEPSYTSSQTRDVPNIATSSVPEKDRMDGVTVVLVGVMLPLFLMIWVLATGIVIIFLLRRRFKLKEKSTTGQTKGQVTRNSIEKRQQEGHSGIISQDSSPEQSIRHGVLADPRPATMIVSGKLPPPSTRLVQNIAYAEQKQIFPPLKERSMEQNTFTTQYDTTTDHERPSLIPPCSDDLTYSYLEHIPTSCDVGGDEWSSQYSKLSYQNT